MTTEAHYLCSPQSFRATPLVPLEGPSGAHTAKRVQPWQPLESEASFGSNVASCFMQLTFRARFTVSR
eukprot:2566083-Amphidinium_carterae.1